MPGSHSDKEGKCQERILLKYIFNIKIYYKIRQKNVLWNTHHYLTRNLSDRMLGLEKYGDHSFAGGPLSYKPRDLASWFMKLYRFEDV
jgi:hypothetical protein